VLVLLLLAGAALAYFSAGRMRTVPPTNRVFFYFKTMLWEWFLLAYVLLGVHWHHTSLEEVTGAAWKRARDFFRDLGIALLFWILALFVLVLLAHLLNPRPSVSFLLPQSRLEVFIWILLSTTAGICEEAIFRGYLQKQFIAWTGSIPAGLFLSACIFGLAHIYQGAKSAVVLGVFGLMFGILAHRRRSMRPGMITHALHDTATGIVMKFVPK
jgi:hypothetical protein